MYIYSGNVHIFGYITYVKHKRKTHQGKMYQNNNKYK